MASNTGHGSSPLTVDCPRTEEGDATIISNALTSVAGQNISAFGRTVTATAGTLFTDPAAPPQHYTAAMSDISKQLSHSPSLQRRVFSFNKRSPTELVRSKLSTAEIQYRALTYLPDELLKNIPDNENSYSLFQGFQASMPEEHQKVGKNHLRKGLKNKLLEGANGGEPDTPLGNLKREKSTMTRQLEMLSIRKNMASSEIREIDMKISNLNQMRNIVLDRLAKLEQDEAEAEHEILVLENKIEDLQEELDEENHHSTDPESDNRSEDSTFMSESIYGKLNAPKSRKRKSSRRISMPILHEHLEPGQNIKEIQTHADSITGLDFDVPFGTLVTAAFDDTVRVWDMNTGRCMGLLEGHQASVRCLQVEDNMVATGSVDASIRLWDLSRAETLPLAQEYALPSLSECYVFSLDSHVDEVTALYFQGDTLVSGSADKTLRQWDLIKGRCVQTLDVLWAAAQSNMDEGKWRNGARSAGGVSGLEGDFVGALQCFDAALACGTADGMVRLWDLRSGQVHRSLVGHTGPVTCLQFDDVHLVTGSLDRSIRIWDLRTGSIFDAFGFDNPITSMQFDSRRIVSAAGETVAKIYDKADGRHWDCGAVGVDAAIVDRVRVNDGYLVQGRRNGTVGIWAC
ncbi:WD40 repeat-like protein [Choiromyces venosus 120613-1]|uniref:Mitochondrial division protein 1 n=1 Tax=Choiromyces venosus 120613-1 TaxID=1336337 RepID=A0A3N4K5S0_9PEZI|nr:WD40 repeat-like protein [Choiromyces venosus 120613-1]